MFARLKLMTRAQRQIEFENITGVSASPKFEWAGDSESLAEQCAQQEASEKKIAEGKL
jgi:hypothetical protein